MLDWLKRTLASFGGLQNTPGYGRAILELLAKDLERLAARDATMPGVALSYIVDGVGGDVPAHIRAKRPHAVMFANRDQDEPARKNRFSLYDHWDELPADFWVRFGNVLAADSPILHTPILNIAAQHRWLDALALDLLGMPVSHYGQGRRRDHTAHANASTARLEALLESVGLPRSALSVAVFQSPSKHRSWTHSAESFAALLGFEGAAIRDAELLRGAFRDRDFENRLYVLRLIASFSPAGLAPFAEELVALTLESSAQVRAAAAPLALRAPGALEIAKREAVAQKPEGRARALKLLWESGDEALRNFVRERGAEDSAASVQSAVAGLVARPAEESPTVLQLQAPEVTVDLEAPLGAESLEELRECFHKHNEVRRQERARLPEKHWGKWNAEMSSSDMALILAQVAQHPRNGEIEVADVNAWPADKLTKLFVKWARRDDVTLVHVVRLLLAIGWIRDRDRPQGGQAIQHGADGLLGHLGRVGRVSLLALEQIFEAYGVAANALSQHWAGAYRGGMTVGWPDDAVWPYFAAHRELLVDGLNPISQQRDHYWFSKQRVFDAIATFPEPPPEIVPALFELALGTGKADRAGAQAALDRYPHKEPQIIQALASRKAEARLAAATWLARLRSTDAVAPLEVALEKEKNDAVAGAMMSALQTLGVPVERFLNRDGLEKESAAGFAKGVPNDLQWFPFDGLPVLEWQDSGERLALGVGRWWVVQAFKLKSPEPGGVLRHYFAMLRPATREAFALYVLQAWLREDVKPIAQADAEKQARAAAQTLAQSLKTHPQYYPAEWAGLTEQQIYEGQLPDWLKRPAGSAIASKGVLAVAAAGGGSEVAPIVQRYLKEWYGTRAAQGKGLIQMLAWVDHPTATQLVLSIGSRFRTKSFQDEATKQAEALAERRNWTLDELSDRTIPMAGFDALGVAEIDYGTRKFTAKLGADFEVELLSPEGKRLSSLPDARKDEDEARVKEAKKQWSAAKKELKGVLQLQRDRLYEGLCTERRWRFEDWSTYLNQHPIVRRYCQRLVWAASAGNARTVFRPLDDGSLTDFDDNAVTIDPDATVSLAHDSNVAAEDAKRWLAHFEDYKVDPLFQQFGKGVYRLPEEQKEATEIEDFRGHLIEAFALRGRAAKLGYTRGVAEDGGWFMVYEKRFPTLGLTATVEFTGNPLPETNRTVALLALSFWRTASGPGEQQNKAALGDVAQVLISECWNDMRLIAAEGSGFDKDWEKKSEYR